MARKQYETKFIAELKRSVFYQYPFSSFWYKLPDDYKFKKPFDIIAAFGRKHFAIEAKVHTKHTAWPLSSIEKHQIEGLQRAEKGGYISFVVAQVVYGKGKERVNFACIITLKEIELFQRQGIKSLKVGTMLKGFCLERTKTKTDDTKEFVWNVRSLCE